MKTAVQLRQLSGDGQPKSDLICGVPSSVVTGVRGPVVLFDADQIVGYRIRYQRRMRLFVFRTLEVDDRLAASVPGVKPHVQLLLEVATIGRARLVRGLFAYLAKHTEDPSGLPDDFYVRVAFVLGGRLPAHKILVSLLKQSASEDVGTIPTSAACPTNRTPISRLGAHRASSGRDDHRVALAPLERQPGEKTP
jgi:hypothetical protein